LRSLSYWRDFVALCSKSTPKEYLNYLKERHIDYIISGEDHVDLLAALMQLNERYAVEVVRVDAGGTMNGLLPGSGPGRRGERADLSHHGDGEERHLQSTKTTPGANTQDGSKNAISLDLIKAERLNGDVVWLRYKVRSKTDSQRADHMGLAGFEPAATRL
jgi:2,5-diamino-6-(ribosylamino)-4(3H)-pyrimidinone 5'-phosphate reductase